MRTLTGQWSDDKELAATQIEMLHAIYRATLAVGGVKQIPKQLRIPRPKPAITPPPRRAASEAEVIDFFTAKRR